MQPESEQFRPDLPQSAGAAMIPALLSGRLHPLTLVLGLITAVRRMIIPAIPLLFIKNRWIGFSLLLLMSGGTVATLLIRYFTFSYRIEDGELRTKEGIFERTERHIPLERIQEIRIEQSVLQRLFDVVEAHIETAAGEGPEASLSVLSRAEAERLRQAVFARLSEPRDRRASAVAAAPEAGPERAIIYQPGWRELVLAGLTSNHLLSGLALVGALWAFADDVLPESFYRRGGVIFGQAVQQLLAQGTRQAVLVGAAILLLLLLVGMIFSVVGTMVLFYGFTLSRSGEDLYRSWGLLTRRASSLPRRRIQVLEIEEGLLRRLCGLAALRADIAGSKREHEDDNHGRDVLLPVIRRQELSDLLPVFFADLPDDRAEWKQVSKLAIRRGTLKSAIVAALLAAGLTAYAQRPLSLWPLALVPLIYWINVRRYRFLGYAPGEKYFHTRRGLLSRTTHIVPVSKVQVIELRQTPFDRRLGLASLHIDTAGQAYTGGGPSIGNLPLDEARRLAESLAHRAATAGPRF